MPNNRPIHNFEVVDTAYIGDTPETTRECIAVVTHTAGGAEIWLYVDVETNELVLAERIDGFWYDLDLDEAREEFADVLYCL